MLYCVNQEPRESRVLVILWYKTKFQKPRIHAISGTLEPGDERIELPPKVLETPIIPLDQSPICICRTCILYHIIMVNVKSFSYKNLKSVEIICFI